MDMKRCKNGHFYDADKYDACPHCNALGDGQKADTMPVTVGGPTEPITVPDKKSLESVVGNDLHVQPSAPQPAGKDDGKTIGIFNVRKSSVEPVVGWLVATDGEHFGEDFRLKAGRNFIGRSNTMDVSLSKDSAVSREKHAIILYEPKENIFIVQPGDSKELCYLNEKVVLAAEKLQNMDIITVGKTNLMFVACCNEKFRWQIETENV